MGWIEIESTIEYKYEIGNTMKPLEVLSKLSAVDAARRLLGCELVRRLDGQELRVKIVETEAYDQTDAASHSYNGRTQPY